MINKKQMGKYLKELRKEKKRKDGKSFSQFDLANEFYNKYDCDISINAIAEWESGNTVPSPENLEILSEIYNRTIDEILDGENKDKTNYKEKYFICDEHWEMNFPKQANLYKIRNEQIKLISTRFKELILIRIKRYFSSSEENEFRFLFDNFYTLSEYGKEYTNMKINDQYLVFKDALNEMLVEIRNMSMEEKYWEIQKLYSEKEILWFSFWRDVCDLKDIGILKERFESLEEWQKDMFLAMFQNIEPYDPDPARYGSAFFKRYEDEHGEYNHETLYKEKIKELISRGSYLNKSFFNVKRGYYEKKRIIDRLEELYNLCLKPIEIHITQNDGTVKTCKIENNIKNRFLNKYYLSLKNALKRTSCDKNFYSDIDEIYKWFISTNDISEDIYLNIAKEYKIDINQEKKYWLAEVKNRSLIDKFFNEFKNNERAIETGLIEIDELKKKLLKGEKEYFIYKTEIIGGYDEKSIREYIELRKSKYTYCDFLKSRDKESTNKLLKEINNLSIENIKEKYFMVEVLENE